jgi:hypothetical protein
LILTIVHVSSNVNYYWRKSFCEAGYNLNINYPQVYHRWLDNANLAAIVLK